MPDSITIPFGPELLATLLALLALIALSLWSGLLPSLLGDRFGQGWGRLPATARAVLGTLGALWGALLLVSVAAGIAGALALVANPGAGGLGLGALLVALLGAPFLIWGTAIRQTTLDYQREGHITDRIAKAVEQLGAEKTVKVPVKKGKTAERSEPNIEVRLGAILSLERIAQDSTRLDNGRDHVRVMEILCAYIRENSNARAPRDFPLPDWEPLKEDATVEERNAHLAWRGARFGGWVDDVGVIQPSIRDWAETLPEPRADVQLALDVIGRRSADQRAVEAAWPDPPGAGAEWVFDRAFPRLPEEPGEDPLPRDDLAAFRTGLGVWKRALRAYHGYRLDLRGANLQRADMSGRCFAGALLQGARMEGAGLRRARMEGADLRRARMEGANLEGARMEAADLRRARMEGAGLRRARMEAADLEGARMEGADLRRARMDVDTSLTAATLRGAAVRDVSLPEGLLSTEQIATMFGDGSVTLPGIAPGGEGWPAHWPTRELGMHEFYYEWRKWQADPEGYRPPD